ncbi:MAG: transporter substrate-binding domain-containing protein [Pseudodesulfovibrio sp.]|jgi:polar amino acid transport system substrate-binding protein|uniref:Amino acid ABC transporter substrate-binding protein n=1 Tax=Pseudodesulfovibrio indicus TaxID=1716143 RepID=A0A126QNK6_9BACT|nr:transporter substrate-binding domain-containing protein [Pseudodesulfovibrio indicus]AMK11511.1 amino acid ABC transporter substrate-binding protein [Pseudodesulfovibrio indicus]TDT89912.1 amino acid ABC transporter substrate-binding protein (PAAT family) [Pseudodesulfovibrio indicus]
MKRIIALVAALSTLIFLFACSQQPAQQAEAPKQDVNVRLELQKASTLEKIVQRGTLRVGLEAGYMPFEMTDKKGTVVGFDVDMVTEMAKAMGVKLEIVNTAWDGIIPGLLSDKYDLIASGMTINQERNLKVNFANPYIVVGQTALIAAQSADKIQTWKDLNNEGVVITSKLGTTGEQAAKRLFPKATYKSFEMEDQAMLETLNGKADATVYDLPMTSIFFAQRGKEAGMKFLNEPFTYEPLGWAINKGDPDFLNWLNNFIVQIRNDGRYERIYNKWFGSNDWYADIQ